MESNLQKKAFISYEADAWFERNQSALETSYNPATDRVINLIKDYNIVPKKVLEIGCSAGYRLNGIRREFNCDVFGIEPSRKAIESGRKNYPEINFYEGTADDLSHLESGSMDVVIVGFVFYVVDRGIMFRVISEIDRVLTNGGILIIIDFFSERSKKNVYHHIKDFSAYSFKQNYDEIFTASKLYLLLHKSTMSHKTFSLDASDDYQDKYVITALKKDLDASYR